MSIRRNSDFHHGLLGIGVLLAYRNTAAGQAKDRTGKWVEDALRASAMIIMVTGLGSVSET